MTDAEQHIPTDSGERISAVAQQWFLTEPLLFSVFCTHQTKENTHLNVPFRTGVGLIEYNAELLGKMKNQELSDRLMVETLRILLKHPYIRQPFRARPEILYLASNMTILDNIGNSKNFHFEVVPPRIAAKLPKGKTFEEYYGLLDQLIPLPKERENNIDDNSEHGNNDTFDINATDEDNKENAQENPEEKQTSTSEKSDPKNSSPNLTPSTPSPCQSSESQNAAFKQIINSYAEAASTWREDTIKTEEINVIIEAVINNGNRWGTLTGSFIELVKSTLVPPVNVANILKGFKKTILSQQRNLTRMRPSRRYGFEQMGSKYAYTTSLLVALDVSGSVSTEMLARMLGLVNRIFTQGIEHIDVLMFDTEIKDGPKPFRKVIKKIKITGRGGTDFQPIADYYIAHPEYDGLIYITDGYAPNPEIAPSHRFLPVTWIITDDDLIPSIRHGWKGANYD